MAAVPAGGLMVLVALAGPLCAQTKAPPAELTTLERQVSLKIAHVRIKGPTNAADLKQLGQAQQAQFDGEKAIAAGDYKKAEQDFLRANVLISAINE
jgi:hypothetical protein